jgi:hypothetical protein
VLGATNQPDPAIEFAVASRAGASQIASLLDEYLAQHNGPHFSGAATARRARSAQVTDAPVALPRTAAPKAPSPG